MIRPFVYTRPATWRAPLSRAEWLLVGSTTLLFAIGVLAPSLSQDANYHRFADARTLLGVPHALDVMSSAAFALVGMSGLVLVATRQPSSFSSAYRASALLSFVGLLATAAASASYHLAPNDAGLALDRHAMGVVFAGILGLVATERISERAGVALAGFSLLVGQASVLWWTSTGSVTPYGVLQFGGLLIVAVCLVQLPRHAGPRWGLLLLAYALAKALEHFDAEVFVLTGESVSGHTLKHLVAALAAWTIVQPISRLGQAQAGRQAESTAPH
jgi:hypothetical protein